ncbi:MAG: nuclear transport factor 2 family protein [Litorimonas sp.]
MTAALAPAIPALAATPAADRAAIATIVESVGTFADTHNFESLAKLYDDDVMVDYSSLSGEPATLKSPQALMTEWASVLPGFDRTRHDLSDVHVVLSGDTASATADVSASHWVEGEMWRVDGRYDYGLERDPVDDAWKITAMTFTVEDETGSRDVFGPATEKARTNPAAWIQRQRAQQTVWDFLTGLEDKDMDRVNGVWAEDAVQHMPYTPHGVDFPSEVVGRDALIRQYAGWPDNAGKADFTSELRFYPTVDPQIVVAEYRGVSAIIPTGRTYDQRYLGLFHVDPEGRIELFREYFNPEVFAHAFGLREDGVFHAGDE